MSIISLIVFVLFSSFMKQLHIYNETSTEIANYAFLKNNLKREFYLSKNTTATTNTLDMVLNDSVSISYLFRNNYTVKKMNANMDTIYIKLSKFNVITNANNTITELELDFLLFEEHLPIVLDKEYTNNLNINSYFIDEN